MSSRFHISNANVTSYDFRETIWGMSRSEVKIAETHYPLSENETHITYRDQYMNLETIVGFHFINDSLVEGGYVFNEILADPKSNRLNFKKVKVKLSSSYGVPVVDCAEKEESNMCITEWKTQRSIIRLLFVSDKLSTEFGVIHIDRKYEANLAKSHN